jgi:uncharacterized protein (DUF58 family)
MADPASGWRPTVALARALGAGAGLLLAAVLLRRADLVVLAAPLVLGAALALATRPTGRPRVALTVPAETLLEGGAATVTATVDAPDRLDVAALQLTLPPWLVPVNGPAPPVTATTVPPGVRTEVPFVVRSVRWGRRQVGPVTLRASGAYGMLRWPREVTGVGASATWPLREAFVASDAVPRAEGLVGAHRSRRPGEGSDVAGVRPFVPGDRLRRINWRVTGRTGELHVTSTYDDRDTEVLLCLDSRQDLGEPPDSSLDIGVRAAAAIAEHYLRAGDRVGLLDLGQRYRPVPARTGRGHLVRLLDVLLDARGLAHRLWSGETTGGRGAGVLAAAELPGLAAADALVVLLSPLSSPASLAAVAALSRAGRSVVVVDTLPAGVRAGPGGDYRELAFRLWRLRRDADLRRVGELGVPVVRWSGAGSLDQVLRDVSRAARAPRVAR